ncbi:MAG TPA: hypothetical protein VHW09_33070 [Bryobacteraceae bacterium]|jgi:hypothetical protein|nr:hypothetical protein [Bryobacteraceae bacterium]
MIPLQVVGNALLLWLGYYWLGIGEGTGGQLLWSAAVALALAAAACWLHGAAFAYFGPAKRQLRPALGTALRHVLPLLVAAVGLAALYWLLAQCAGWSASPAFRIASYLTMKLRKPVKPSSVLRWFQSAIWLLEWMVVPVLALPMISAIAGRGWAGFRDFGARLRSWLYWIETPLLALLAFWVPFRLFDWVPKAHGFGMEMTSFVLRFGVGYLLCIAVWLLLVFVTVRGTPRPSSNPAM